MLEVKINEPAELESAAWAGRTGREMAHLDFV